MEAVATRGSMLLLRCHADIIQTLKTSFDSCAFQVVNANNDAD
jgi:porphobilinogen deaminase